MKIKVLLIPLSVAGTYDSHTCFVTTFLQSHVNFSQKEFSRHRTFCRRKLCPRKRKKILQTIWKTKQLYYIHTPWHTQDAKWMEERNPISFFSSANGCRYIWSLSLLLLHGSLDQKERAGVAHCGSCSHVDVTGRKKRKNSDLLVLYRQRRYTRRNERGYGPCKTREVQRRSYCGHQTIVLFPWVDLADSRLRMTTKTTLICIMLALLKFLPY